MESVFETLKAMEKASVIEIAARTGIDRDEVVNHLWDLKRHGRVDRHGRAWSVIDSTPAAELQNTEPANEINQPAPAAPAEKTTAEIVEAIQAFTAHPDGLVIPSARFISSEIRRAEARVVGLKKMLHAARVLRRHKHLLVGHNHG